MDSADKVALIRQMRAEDSEEISRIYNVITKQAVDANFVKLIQAHARDRNSASFVAELDGKVVGFMISYVITLGFGIETSAWIATMGVDPRYMGQGIGARLAAQILNAYKAKGINRVFTSVLWDSTDLLSFFRTLGFERSDFINLTKKLD